MGRLLFIQKPKSLAGKDFTEVLQQKQCPFLLFYSEKLRALTCFQKNSLLAFTRIYKLSKNNLSDVA